MATWVRTGTGTAPSATDADLTGAVTLDNGTAPGDFDPDGVTNINIAWRLTIAGLSDDDWTDNRSARLRTAGSIQLGTVDLSNTTRSANGNYDSSGNDATPTSGQTVSAWEGATIDSGPVTWAVWNKTKGGDGTTASIPVANVVVTITYTPASGDVTATPAVVAATVTVPAPTNVTAAALVTPAVNTATVDVKAVTTAIGFDVSPATVAGTFTVPPVTVDIAGPPTIEVDAWRIYEDGAEASSTALGVAVDQGAVVEFDTPFLVRFLVKNTGTGAATFQPKLQTRYMPPGTGGAIDWVPARGLPSSPTEITFADMIDLTATSTHANAVASGTISDNAATTQRLGAGTFVAGKVDTGDGAFASSWSIPAGQETEVVFCVELDSTDFATVDDKNNQYEVQFRIVDDIGEALYDVYNNGTSALGEVFARVNPPWTWENDLEAGTSGNSLSTADSNSPDGWDAINEGTGATIEYFNSDPWDGSLHGIIDDSTSNLCRIRWHDINQGVQCFFRAYIKPISNGSQIINFIYATGGYNDGDETLFNVDYNNDRTLTLQDKNGTTIGSTAALSNSPTDYYRIEIGWRPESGIDVGDGFLELRLFTGNSTTADETITDTTALSGTEFEDLDFGPRRGSDTMVMYFDMLAFSNADWVGPISSGVTVTPAVVAATTTFPLPTVQAAATVEPTVVATTVNVLAVTTDIASDPITVTPTVVAATVNVLAPTVQAAATVEPATVAATVNVLAPTVLAAATVTPATVASTVDVLAVTVTAPAVVTPAVVAATVNVLAPTATAGALVTPAVVAATVDVLAVTVDVAGGPVTVTPAVVSTTATIEPVTATAAALVAPAVVATTTTTLPVTVDAPSTVTPAVVSVTVDVLAITVTAGSAVTPAVVAASVNVLAPTVTAAALVTPATVAMTTDTPTPAVNVEGGPVTTVPAVVATSITVEPVTASHPATTTPAVVAASVTVEPVTIAIPYTVTPAVVGTAATILSPVVTAAALVTPAVVAGTVDVLAVTVDVAGSDITVTPAVVGITVDVKAVTVDAPTIVAPAVVSGAFDTKAVTVTAGATVTPSVVAGTFTILPVTTLIGGDTVVTPRVVNRQFRFWYSLPSHPALVTPTEVAVTADVPAVTVGAETTVTPATVAMTVTVLPVTQAIGTTKVFPATVTASVIVYPATHTWPPNINDNAGDTTDENVGGRTRRASVAGSSTGASSKGTTRGTTGIQGTTEYNP